MARVLLLLALSGLVLGAASVKPTARAAANQSTNSTGNAKQTFRGISAWGIVALVISVILLSMGAYYFIIFYPLMCAKERKYDVIDSSSV